MGTRLARSEGMQNTNKTPRPFGLQFLEVLPQELSQINGGKQDFKKNDQVKAAISTQTFGFENP